MPGLKSLMKLLYRSYYRTFSFFSSREQRIKVISSKVKCSAKLLISTKIEVAKFF